MAEKSLEAYLYECLKRGNTERGDTKKALYIVKLLGDDVNKLYGGKSLLLWAKEFENKEVIQALEEKGAIEEVIGEEEKNKLSFELIQSIKAGDLIKIDELIFAGADVNYRDDEYHLTPLMWVAKARKKEIEKKIIEKLIENGADIEAKNDVGQTVLMIASYNNHLGMIEKLIEVGVDVNQKDEDGKTALMLASSYYNNLEAVQMLIKAGADVNQKDNNGITALINASMWGHVEIIKMLVKAGADVNQKDNDGINSFMHIACISNLEAMQVLVDAKADINQKDNEGNNALMYASLLGKDVDTFIKLGMPINEVNNKGQTALMLLSRLANNDNVEKMIKAGADVNQKDEDGNTALMHAVKRLYVVKEEIGGYNIEAHTSVSSRVGIMKKLIEARADVNIKNNNGETALMYVASNGDLEILQVLIDANADINAKDNDGNNALMYACLKENYALIKELLKLGINVDEKNNKGQTALMLLSKLANNEDVEILIKAGADVNQKDDDGNTALMHVVKGEYRGGETVGEYRREVYPSVSSRIKLIKKLIEEGADVNIKNNQGQSALMLAENEEIRSAIFEAVKKKNEKSKEKEPSFVDRVKGLFGRGE